MNHAVRVTGLTRRFGRRWALRGVDFAAPRGTVTAVLGDNGSGKTTLLRVLSTLLRPTESRVSVLGCRLPAGADQVRARTGLMTTGGHAYGDLTGVENLRFAARMGGLNASPDELRAALADAGLGGTADVPVRDWSTGMRRRLELARLSLRPLDLVLLDEPFASLDEAGARLARDAIRAWREAGATVLVASHRSRDIARIADHATRLEQGLIAE